MDGPYACFMPFRRLELAFNVTTYNLLYLTQSIQPYLFEKLFQIDRNYLVCDK